ncbi:MAG: CHASE2 domain-containing protein [Candidatus Omnitrophica bacterium]|nr:CHASE2 domain-containing protein [Candidatus Omnitrophota bacterium]
MSRSAQENDELTTTISYSKIISIMKFLHRKLCITLFSVVLSLCLFSIAPFIPQVKDSHWKLYDILLRTKNVFQPVPAVIKDIVLVTIDNETLKNMSHSWPYPRSAFAGVIEQLIRVKAKVIAIDFVFLGKTTESEDGILTSVFKNINMIVLAMGLGEDGSMGLATPLELAKGISAGVVTKMQDHDGVIRRNLTYLVSERDPRKGFLSWGMGILKSTDHIDLSTLAAEDSIVSFRTADSQDWAIPVEPVTKSYLINYRANTSDFERVSFYNILNGDFNPASFRNKIILIGITSAVLGDLHNTPIGWLPGLTVNANAFLTLYTRDFLKELPRAIELLVIILGVVLSSFFAAAFKLRQALAGIACIVIVFFIASYILLSKGFVWNYALFPLIIFVCPLASRKIYFLWQGYVYASENYLI